MSKLDDTKLFGAKMSDYMGWPDAKAELKALFLELIGEDDWISKPSGNSRFDQQVQSEITAENKLKAELRKAVESL